jgi:hypothetical protein
MERSEYLRLICKRFKSIIDSLLTLTFNKLYQDVLDVKGAELPNLREFDVCFEFNEIVANASMQDWYIVLTFGVGRRIFEFVSQLVTPVLQRMAITNYNESCWSEPTD